MTGRKLRKDEVEMPNVWTRTTEIKRPFKKRPRLI
jgi:hypothetical protein